MNIFDYTIADLKEYMKSSGEKEYRAKQVYKHVYDGIPFEEMTDISKELRKKLSEDFEFSLPKIKKKLVSKLDGTRKYLFEMSDGAFAEGVVMEYRHGLSMCVSSQVGCRMGCAFCASTLHGLQRNLTAGEISGQIMTAQRDLKRRISNIVMMGSGEPFDNFENVMKFIKIAVSPDGLGIGARHITVSTCGLTDGIYALAESGIPVNLSISLHAPNDKIRQGIMPVARAVPVEKLIKAARDFFEKTKRRVTYEYALIDGVNDSDECARELAALIGHDGTHVNLIPVNAVKERNYKKSRSVERFMKLLAKSNINATVRREMGADISAACGQLRNENISGMGDEC